MTGYAYAPKYWDAGWVPVPLPHGKKTPPPKGTTGRTARAVSFADVQTWVDQDANANIGLALPKNVVGLDFDLYKDEGRQSWARMNELCGPLPITWSSTSRTDGSGILLFRTDPERTDDLRDPIGNGKGGFEIIRWSHRYVVVAPSLSPPPPVGSGNYYRWIGPDGAPGKAPRVEDLPFLPQSWLDALTPEAKAEHSAATVPLTAAGVAKASSYEQKAVQGCIDRLRAMALAAQPDPHSYQGEPWDQTTFTVACRLFEIANAEWSQLTVNDVQALVMQHAPRDGGFDGARIRDKIVSAHRRTAGSAAAPPTGITRIDDSDMFETPSGPAAVASPTGRRVIAHGDELDVSSTALVTEWLRENIGTGRLSGVFYRKGEIVYTPSIGEQGYIEPRAGRAEGAAAISVMDQHELASRIQFRYQVTRMVEDKAASKGAEETVYVSRPAMFPIEAAKFAVNAADDMTNLRELHGVVHAPTFRPDGTLITRPGYDEATGLLFLPTGGQPDAIPEHPTGDDVRLAVRLISTMLQDFAFVTASDRANYVGLMLTPLLRTLAPPPYKLGVIEAHQPGSGKTFLARALTSIHGGLFHSELPGDEAELIKTITTILDVQTSPVVVFDNVTGLVRSPSLAGLLTSPTFQGRRLGSTALVEADNDRLWVITGNNAALGGDLQRRNVRVRIDPGVPNPEDRTEFAITNFERWVRENRGALLWSLIVLVRHWVVQGSPVDVRQTQDSYGVWVGLVRGVLSTAGMPGLFDDPALREQAVDPEAQEWGTFLEAIYEQMAETGWTAKDLLRRVQSAGFEDPTKPIPWDVLPGGLTQGRGAIEPSTLSKTLGRWLMNREGRWANQLTVRRAGTAQRAQIWSIQKSDH